MPSPVSVSLSLSSLLSEGLLCHYLSNHLCACYTTTHFTFYSMKIHVPILLTYLAEIFSCLVDESQLVRILNHRKHLHLTHLLDLISKKNS